MALLAAMQPQGGAARFAPAAGPIPTQNPQPGFRAPGTPGMQAPQRQEPQNNAQQMQGLSNALAMYKGSPGTNAGIPGSQQAAQNAVNANGPVVYDPATGLNTTPGLGGYTAGSAPSGGYGGYAGYADTLPGFGGGDSLASATGSASAYNDALGAGTGAAGDTGGGAAGGGFGALGGLGMGAAIAAAIGLGKNTEANHPNTPGGDASLGLLGPDAAQIFKDPIGMGLPTLLGVPFITPFTGSQDAKAAKPEWSSFFGLGF